MIAKLNDAPAGSRTILTDELLDQVGGRAATYDRDNTFFWEDFDQLKELGYLLMAVPEELGGLGFTFAEVMNEQRRLAQRAPSTALALNMHHYWVGLASDLRTWGDPSLEWMLRDAASGEVFAAGHGETGNDIGVQLATTTATRVEGGYRINGRKIFGSLSPVWTRFGFQAMDADAPGGPQIVHGFLVREDEGYTIKDTWDTLGMRATQSHDTVFEDVFVPDSRIGRIIPAGEADPFLLAMVGRGIIGFAAIYIGLAERAFQLGIDAANRRTSIGLTRSMAYHPEIQHTVAEMAFGLEAIQAQFQGVTNDWSNHVDHGAAWMVKVAAAKYNVVETAKAIVDGAMTVSGGGGLFRRNELERLYRDVRAGGFHPFNGLQAHEIAGKMSLGIDPGEQPRWG